jgi:hypothetical protein
MRNDRELQKAVLAVMLGKKEESVSETVKHPNQQVLDVHEPEKDELTAKDFEMLRKGKKAKKEDDMKEATSMAQQAAIAIAKKKAMKEEVELADDADETVFIHTPVEYEVKESYNFGDYLSAAKNLVGEEEAINLANEKYNKQDVSIFTEEFMRSDIEDRIKTHQKAGHKVSMPKYMTKSGKPYAEYVVTDKESGVRRKYIHHGNARSVENMGAAGKKNE